MSPNLLVVLGIWSIASIILWAPRLAGHAASYRDRTVLLTLLMGASLLAPSGVYAFAAAGAIAVLHALSAASHTRTGSAFLLLSAAAALVAALALALGSIGVAFIASSLSVALRVGLAPLHAGASRLCERLPALQSQQLATATVLVVAHLRFIDHSAVAYDVAAWLVRIGAVMTLLPALLALVQQDLRGFYRATTVMHGGMIFAAMGAAGRGHTAAALMVVMTTAAAMTGLGLMVQALERRVGLVSMFGPGGRAHAFPRLAASFVIFVGAGVAMPGTAGFIADDLLLHALWEESVWGTVTVILGSAVLAIAGLVGFSRIFLGAPQPSLAVDLHVAERVASVVLLLVLVWLGLTPGTLLTPADEFLGTQYSPLRL